MFALRSRFGRVMPERIMQRCFSVAAIVVTACMALSANGPDLHIAADEPDPKIAEFVKVLDGMRDYRCNRFLKAGQMAQALGKDAASKVLLRHSGDHDGGLETSILCRMLFVARSKGFRRPMFGLPEVFGGTKPADWPLEPIELVDGVPFVIANGYLLAGCRESNSSYVDYCIKNCDWSKEQFRLKSEKELKTALDKLLKSPKWQRSLEEFEIDFLKVQILEKGP
jgi:hypothetical protein